MVALFTTAFPFEFPFPALIYAVLNKYADNPLAPHVISVDVLDRKFLEDGTVRSERLIGVQQDSPKWVNRLLGSQDVTYVREVSFAVPSATRSPYPTTASSSSNFHLEPPKLLMASTNLTLANILQCRESISYLPHPWPHVPSVLAPLASSVPEHPDSQPPTPKPNPHPLSHPLLPPHTLFSQSALIYSGSMFASESYPPIGISKDSPISPLSFPRAATAPQRAAGRKIENWSKDRFEMNAETGRRAMGNAAEKFWNSEKETKVALEALEDLGNLEVQVEEERIV